MSFGGTSFSSFGVVRVMDDYMDMPERRGENVLLPFRHGTVFEPKYYDERKITFGLYVQKNSATDQDDTFDTIRKLFGKRTQQTLNPVPAKMAA